MKSFISFFLGGGIDMWFLLKYGRFLLLFLFISNSQEMLFDLMGLFFVCVCVCV